MTNQANQILTGLIEIDAIQIKADHSFTWTSGIKSPIYCDNRLTISYPEIRKKVAEGFAAQVKAKQLDVDVIVGCATAGIPHAAWLADCLDKPMAYVRGQAKGHGKGNQIEGAIRPGDRVIVVEDLISTGGSVLSVIKAIEAAGGIVEAVLAIFSYGLQKAANAFKRVNVPCYTLANFDQLVDLLIVKEEINGPEAESLIEWRDQLD
ncbi:orotate phosphoribosyltransferase [Amphibacillus sp. Q70]|uniref:orotate phosphoribosyltransferase n=1 Tax=Amphibacillus sp. Q70 TaxID=3453416 RepID=UPI003F869FAC